MLNEDKYLTAVAAAVPKSKLKSLEDVLKDPNQTFGWQANSDVLLLNNVDEVSGPKDKLSKKHVFVLDFFGDVQASQAAQLREEVTGLLRSAKKERGGRSYFEVKHWRWYCYWVRFSRRAVN